MEDDLANAAFELAGNAKTPATAALPHDAFQHIDETFVRRAVEAIAGEIRVFSGGGMDVGAFSPPRVGDEHPQGMLMLEFDRPGCVPKAIALDFGVTESRSTVRYEFDAQRFRDEPLDPHACGLTAATWAEAWEIVSRVARELAPRRLELFHGA